MSMSRDVTVATARRWLAGSAVSAVGASLLAVPAAWGGVPELAAAADPVQVTVAAVLVVGGAWLGARDWDPRYAATVSRWTVAGGLGAGALFGVVVLARGWSPAVALAVDGTAVGAAIAFGAGLRQAAQRRSRDELAERVARLGGQQERLRVAHRLLQRGLRDDVNVAKAALTTADGGTDLRPRLDGMSERLDVGRRLVAEDGPGAAGEPVALRPVVARTVARVENATPPGVDVASLPAAGTLVRAGPLLEEALEAVFAAAVRAADRRGGPVTVASERTTHEGSPAVSLRIAAPWSAAALCERWATPSGDLAPARAILDLYGGGLDVHAPDGDRTAVTVTLPLAAPP